MRSSHFLLSVLSGFLVSTALSSSALAQKGRYFGDSSPWQVADVRGDDSGGQEYCVLSRAYNEDVAITIAENAQGETSVALHFLKEHMDFSGIDSAVFDPGAGQTREASATPLSDSSVMVKIGRDPAFFKALAKTGFLRVALKGQNFNFDLSDFDQGRSQLKACIASLSSQSTMAIAKSEIVTPEPALRESYTAESGVSTPVANVDAEKVIAPPSAPMASAASSVASAPVALAKPVEAVNTAGKEAEIVSLRNEIKHLEDRLAVNRAGEKNMAELSEQVQMLTQENVSLREKQQALGSDVARSAVTDTAASEALEQRVHALLVENETLKTEQLAAEAMRKDNSALQTQLREAEQRRAALQTQILSLEQEKTTLSAKAEAAASEVASLESVSAPAVESADLQGGQLDALRGRNTELMKLVEQAQYNQQDLQQKLNAETKKVETLQAGIAANKANSSGDLQQYEQKIAALQVQLIEAQSVLDASRAAQANEVASLKSGSDELVDMQEKLMMLEAQQKRDAAAYEGKISGLSTELASAKAALEGKEAAGATEIAALKSESQKVAALQAQLDAAEKARAAEAAAHGQEIQAVQAELAAAKVALDGVRVAQSDEMKAVQAERDRLKADLANLESQAGQQQQGDLALREELRGLQDVNSALVAENASLKEHASVHEAQLQELKLSLDKMRSAQDKLAMRLQESEAALKQSEARQEELAQQLKGAQGERDEALAQAAVVPEPVRVVEEVVIEKRIEEDDSSAVAEIVSATAATVAVVSSSTKDVVSDGAVAVQEESLENVHAIAAKRNLETMREDAVEQIAEQEPAYGEEEIAAPYEVADMRNYENEAQRLEQELSREIERGEPLQVRKRAEIVEDVKPVELEKPKVEVNENLAAKPAAENAVAEVEEVEELAPMPSAAPQDVAANEMERLEREMDQGTDMVSQAQAPQAGTIAQNTVSADMPHSNGRSVEALLSEAGIRPSQGVQPVASKPADGVMAYQWSVGSVYGMSEQQVLVDQSDFDEKVKEYLMRTEARCEGEFAVVPSDSTDFGSMRVDAYDVACMSGGVEGAASLLFYNQNGYFSAISHEGEASNMEVTMGLRDNLVKSFSNPS
jgi:chromosome segregation ATPase